MDTDEEGSGIQKLNKSYSTTAHCQLSG